MIVFGMGEEVFLVGEREDGPIIEKRLQTGVRAVEFCAFLPFISGDNEAGMCQVRAEIEARTRKGIGVIRHVICRGENERGQFKSGAGLLSTRDFNYLRHAKAS